MPISRLRPRSSIKGDNCGCRCCCYCSLGLAPGAQLLKKSTWLLHLIGDKAPPAVRDSSEVTRAVNRHCHSHTRNGGHSWCLSTSPSLSIGFSIQDEAMDAARSAPHGAHYYVDVINLLTYLGINRGACGLWYSGIGLRQLSSQSTFFIPRWTTHLYNLYQVCDACGSTVVEERKIRYRYYFVDLQITWIGLVSNKNYNRQPRIITVIA